jgi:hypothetical protein
VKDLKINLLSNIFRSTLVELKTILEICSKWKMTSMKDDHNGRSPKKLGITGNELNFLSNMCGSTLVELKITLKRWERWKTTSRKDGRTLQ